MKNIHEIRAFILLASSYYTTNRYFIVVTAKTKNKNKHKCAYCMELRSSGREVGELLATETNLGTI